MTPQAGEARPAPDEFASLAEAEAWLAGVPQAIETAGRSEFAALLLRSERAYDQFPELAVAVPRRTLLRRFRAAAAVRPAAEAIALLTLCAAADPADAASLAGLFERAARADEEAFLLPLLRLFRRHADLGWEALGPAVGALIERRADAAVLLETVGAALDGTGPLPEDAELGRVLAALLFAEAPAAIDRAVLVRGAAAARRRLSFRDRSVAHIGGQGRACSFSPSPPASGGRGLEKGLPTDPKIALKASDGDEERRRKLLALAGRLRARLQPPPRPLGAVRCDRPGGEIGFPAFVAQWPELAIEVPARQLHTQYAALDADGMLRAERHAAGAFCYGPYLNLPAGRYRVGIVGEADAGAEYVAQVVHRPPHGKPTPLCASRHVRDRRIVGVVAELAFASGRELRDFEVVVNIASPSAAFAIAAVTITADRLRSDPED